MAQVVARGAELVDFAEMYYVRVYEVTVRLLGAVVVLTLAMTPLGADPADPAFTLPALGTIGAGAALGLLRPRDRYRALRNHPTAAVAAVAAVAIALAVGDPVDSALWLVAFGVLSVTVIVGDDARAASYASILLLLGYVFGVIAHGHLEHFLQSPELILQAAGYPFWAVLLYGMIDRGARLVLRVDQVLAGWPQPGHPRSAPAFLAPTHSPRSADELRPAVPDAASNLTARQAQVVFLIGDGWSHAEIAEHHKVSVRQVERHLHNATERVGARNTNHLVALVCEHYADDEGISAADQRLEID